MKSSGFLPYQKKRQSESGVIMYMSKTSEDKIQMVFTDSNPATSQGQAAVDMASNIQDDISQSKYSRHLFIRTLIKLNVWLIGTVFSDTNQPLVNSMQVSPVIKGSTS